MSFPKLTKLFELISADNGGCTADEIEEMLGSLTDEELDTLATGEYSDQKALCERLRDIDPWNAAALLDMLSLAFDGTNACEETK